jgi:hypothetical protein
MKRHFRGSFFLFVFFIFLLPWAGLFASGRKEAQELNPLNTDFVISVTAIDASSLSLSRQIMGETVTRKLAEVISGLNLRFRGEEEYAYYMEYAWARNRGEAARAIQTRRDERDRLIFRGDPLWRYQRSLRTIDEAILKLEEEMVRVDTLAPAIEGQPVLRLSDGNRNGIFPGPPKPGEEIRFCTTERADAFITGSLSEFHGRVYLEIRMYTLYSTVLKTACFFPPGT